MIKKYNEMKTENDSIQDLIKKYKNQLVDYEYMPHSYEDCEGMSDEDCMSIGQNSGRIQILRATIEALENLLKNK